ncbi:hypothetical protein BC936DRAFT_147532 [Jimgerdemannia flammicorona]|uniref:Uncharacterized protein n=1 Tax=Jimgerdemannia flammicorona TaxID=994334 RepID=A0A433D520_9FUNG|nr:hypothetical protein BC936DRAFT_147532 [Jimgerdemannia flammicorona]
MTHKEGVAHDLRNPTRERQSGRGTRFHRENRTLTRPFYLEHKYSSLYPPPPWLGVSGKWVCNYVAFYSRNIPTTCSLCVVIRL